MLLGCEGVREVGRLDVWVWGVGEVVVSGRICRVWRPFCR